MQGSHKTRSLCSFILFNSQLAVFFCRVNLSCADSWPTFSGPDVIAGRGTEGGRSSIREQAEAIKDGPIPLSQGFFKTASVLYVMRGNMFF